MSKAISYALYGYGREQNENCFSFNSYIRSLAVCLRVNRLLYGEWVSVIHLDFETYGAFKGYFDSIRSEKVDIVVCGYESLCKNMLWRLKPIFEQVNGDWKYTHVICRDVDSPATYREVQAVEQWISLDTACHAITDSISHNIPFMGGLVGFRPCYFKERMDTMEWDELMRKSGGINFSQKGSDQDFLNSVIFQKFAQHGSSSITQHFFNGCPNLFLPNYFTCTCPPTSGHADNCPNNFKIDLPDELKESNYICGHCGSSGAYQSALEKFLRKYRNMFNDLYIAEEKYPEIFYWTKDKSLG